VSKYDIVQITIRAAFTRLIAIGMLMLPILLAACDGGGGGGGPGY